jgi:hypothetical protein
MALLGDHYFAVLMAIVTELLATNWSVATLTVTLAIACPSLMRLTVP